jgi:hypothetical protein
MMQMLWTSRPLKMASVTCHEQCDIGTTSQQAFTKAPLPQQALFLSILAPNPESELDKILLVCCSQKFSSNAMRHA